MSNPQDTIPAQVAQAVAEDRTWGIDCTEMLSTYPGGTTITSAACSLTDPNGVVVALVEASTIVGLVVNQRIPADTLTVNLGGTYTLTALINPSSTSDLLEAVLEIGCRL